MVHDKFLKPYDPNRTEKNIYKLWEESGFFNPDVCIEKGITNRDSDTFSMVLPPPNVTGTLHMGHAFEGTIQDTVIRFQRMLGKRTLWIPGTDHAAIATESKVTKLLSKKGIKRNELGREKFLDEINAFTKESHDIIIKQIKKMGASLDWSREAYTLDEARQTAVYTTFKSMYDDGLIYRGHRIVNWDPKGQTVISDDEIVRKEEKTTFYYLKYGPFIISTARPETKFGDKYVVMHPNDKRYVKYEHRQKIDLEWINGPTTTTIIKDDAVDMNFGTGVMTITPWHDVTDFEIAQRHNLDKEQIIDKFGKLLPIAGEFAGVKISEARINIVKKLEKKGLIKKVDNNYVHQLATAERTNGIIEPQIMEQWFVDVNKEFAYPHDTLPEIKRNEIVTLKKLMRHVVETDNIKVMPDRFKKVYYHWIDNLRDWNISRQLWFGHRIPVWYHEPICIPITGREKDIENCKKVLVSKDKPKCKHCAAGYIQDPDTLDTWFSSGLWSFSTLGWPEKTKDLKTYHPTQLLNPGYEILFFWVARMILMSTYLIGDVPFKTVYLHGMVRDASGKKFSKSIGNGIDPVMIVKKYGADAMRMALMIGVSPGADSNFSEEQVVAYKKFANKLWNITRFVLENTDDISQNTDYVEYTKEDNKLIYERNILITDITKDIESYRLYLAGEKLYHYVWHTLADSILEESKEIFENENEIAKLSRKHYLYETLIIILKSLHPFMPFITEEIWQELPQTDSVLLMVSKWPMTKL